MIDAIDDEKQIEKQFSKVKGKHIRKHGLIKGLAEAAKEIGGWSK